MPPLLQRRSTLVALGGLILFAGLAAGAWNRTRVGELILADLMTDAKRCAVAFDPAELRSLVGAKADAATPAYAAVKARLRRLHDVHPQVHYVYLFRFLPAGNRVVFLADSATPGAKDESLPGDNYENFQKPDKAPGLRAIIAGHQPATEGPEADEFGEWVTGYALVGDPPPAGATVDILGLDLDAAGWRRDLWLAALTAACFVWLLLGVPLAALVFVRRSLAQREALRNLSEAMEQSQSAVLIVDLDNQIEYANAGLCRQLGFTRRELIGRTWRDFQVPETPPELIAAMVATLRAGQTWTGEWFNRRKSGEAYPVRGVITPVKERDGRLACFVAVFDDMTAFKRHEALLESARDRAEAGDRAKGRFLATMSHELHTPLNGIVGFTSLLADTNLSREQRDCVETIRQSAHALLRITSDVLDYSRIEAGRVALEPAPCDPRALVEETLDLLAAAAAEKNLELLHSAAPAVPAEVTLDAGRLRQVLVNLVGNAIKFTATGEIEITLRLAVPARPESGVRSQELGHQNPETQNSAALLAPAPPPSSSPPFLTPDSCLLDFTVRDTGPGIAPAEQARLFQPFSQLDDGIRRRHGGAGLGLAISRHLARLMGGDITLESTPGAGATFRLVLPVENAAAPAPSLAKGPLAGRRIALVCARPGLRHELAATLAAVGAESFACEPAAAPAATADAIVADCDSALLARARAGEPPAPGWPAARSLGLVPATLATADRQALHPHFFRLLAKPLHHAALAAALAPAPRPPTATPFYPRLGLRLLLVDDNPVNLRLLQSIVAVLGCTATTADNGATALAALATGSPPDALVLDLHMPEMDGLEVLRRVRSGAAGAAARALWIIVVTADQRAEMRDYARSLGASDYLVKPVTVDICLAALQRRPASAAAG